MMLGRAGHCSVGTKPAHLLLSVAGLRYWSAPDVNHGIDCAGHLFSMGERGRIEPFVRVFTKRNSLMQKLENLYRFHKLIQLQISANG